MTGVDVSAQSIMASTTVLIARTISITAGVGARISDSTSEERRRQMSPWISAEQGVDGSDKSCGCLPQPPDFDLPPPPVPPSSFGEFGSVPEGVDWTTALTSDPMLESCQQDMDRWANTVGDDVFIPKWTGDEIDDAGKGEGTGDDFLDNPAAPQFFGFFDQPLVVLVIIAAGASVIFLSICLLAFYFRKKSSRRNCFNNCCLCRNKTALSYQHRNGYSPSMKGRRRSNADAKILAVAEGASPATTTTTVIAPRSGYRAEYSLSNACDSAEEMSEGEDDHFLRKGLGYNPTAAAKDWSYNAMRPVNSTSTKRNASGVNARINNNFNTSTKYGAIPPDPPSYRTRRPPPLPVIVTRSESGKIVTRASPPAVPRACRPTESSLLYDSHNPIYEEISLHEKSADHIVAQRRTSRGLSEGVGNYVDSGASSTNSDANFQFADGEEDDDEGHEEGIENERPVRYYAVDGVASGPNSLAVAASPCCSSGRSDCEECCIHESESMNHSRNACPFSPRPRHRQRRQDLVPASSMTPSPIRTKYLTNKINRSTQSGESCLGNDEFYSNCYECSGRESGYGTEGRRHPTPQHRIRNRCGDLKPANRNGQTMDAMGNRDENRSTRHQNQSGPSAKFYTMRNDRHLDNACQAPVVPDRRVANGKAIGSPRGVQKRDGIQLQAMSSDNVHLHKSAFV